jgi:anti-sigma regulatory factor (Ser/Thr protein kinase)
VSASSQRGRLSVLGQVRVGSIAEMDRVIEAILEEMNIRGYGERDVFGVRLSLEEAITNGLKHGNEADPAKAVEVTWQVDAQRVLAIVEDEGSGFDPTHIADPKDRLHRKVSPRGRGLGDGRHSRSIPGTEPG